jgi:hypothetical protein
MSHGTGASAAKAERYELALVDSAPHLSPGAAIIARLADLAVRHALPVGGPEHRRHIVEVVKRYPGEAT